MKGMDADIVVIDLESIGEFGTNEEPNEPTTGVQSVAGNGKLVVQGGELILDAGPGQPIRRNLKESRCDELTGAVQVF
jgi:N-acyl-D-aspartate/D-glutamate deacylase